MSPEQIQNFFQHHPLSMNVEYKPGPHTYHRFYDDGGIEQYYGVTSLIKKYSPFEGQKIKHGIVNSKKPEYAHLNNIADVEAEWEAARQEGSDMHDDLENWGITGQMPERPAALKAIQYFEDHELTPIGFEYVIYCDVLKRATPIDLLLVDKYGQLVVSDYKTSKTIRYEPYVYNRKEKRMNYPLTHLPTSNFFGYSLQIGLAQEWLRRYYELPFKIAPYGLIFHVRNGELEIHRTLSMRPEIRKIYDWEQKIN